MVLYAMACARLPFSDEDMRALAKEGYQGKVKFSKRVSKGMWIKSSGGSRKKNIFSALRASVGSKNKGSPGPSAPPLDSPLKS